MKPVDLRTVLCRYVAVTRQKLWSLRGISLQNVLIEINFIE